MPVAGFSITPRLLPRLLVLNSAAFALDLNKPVVFSIKAQPLGSALPAFAAQSNVNVEVGGIVTGERVLAERRASIAVKAFC